MRGVLFFKEKCCLMLRPLLTWFRTAQDVILGGRLLNMLRLVGDGCLGLSLPPRGIYIVL